MPHTLLQTYRDAIAIIGLVACLYSLGCMLLFDAGALLFSSPNKLSNDELHDLFDVLGVRFDRVVSLLAVAVFAGACVAQAGRKAGCERSKVSTIPVLCNEFANMIGLSSYLLLAMDVLPVYRSPFGRVVPLARLADWFSSRPLMAVLTFLFDIDLPSDIYMICLHTFILQLSIFAHAVASVSSKASTAKILLEISLATFPAIYIRLYFARRRLHDFKQRLKSTSPEDASYPLNQFALSRIIKSVNALTLFGILFGFLRMTYILVILYIMW